MSFAPRRVRRPLAFVVLTALIAALAAPFPASADATWPHPVISQAYAGGGAVGSTYTHDFVEIHNPSVQPVPLVGWSIQYASAVGTVAQITPLSGTLAPGGYLLVQLATSGGGTTPLPTPDVTGTTNLAATGGKIALVNGVKQVPSWASTEPSITDLLGYGLADAYEGSAPALAPGSASALLRVLDGNQDTGDNRADFAIAAPAPRNAASPASLPPGEGLPPSAAGVAVSAEAPVPLPALTFAVAPGAAPDGGVVSASGIDFGMLAADSPKTGSHLLSVATNASGGYTVTAEEDRPLTSGSSVIPDVLGDLGGITEALAGTWASPTAYGFGYTLSNVRGDAAAFSAGYKQFADKAGGEPAQPVMSAAAAATNEVEVGYKVNIGPGQAQGSYANVLTYVATGNF